MKKALEILQMINPINISKTSDKFKNEPFVVSADVYTTGEGGWSWYTGSCSWLYKVILNDILGINFQDNKLFITPCKLIDSYDIKLNFDNLIANISIKKSGKINLVVNNTTIKMQDEKYIVNLKNQKDFDIIVEY